MAPMATRRARPGRRPSAASGLVLLLVAALLTACTSTVGGSATADPAGVIELRAPAAGRLPGGDTVTVGGVTLGSGTPIHRDDDPNATPIAWLSAEPATVADWSAVAAQFSATGLWPVLVRGTSPDGQDDRALDRPWLAGEFDEPDSADGIDVSAFLRDAWAWQEEQNLEYGDESNGPWRGPATGSPGPAQLRLPADLVATTETSPGLVLVPVTRPADVVAALGWSGATNYWRPGEVSAVLRSWEDRFGAVLVHMDFDSLYLVVQRPPVGAREINLTAGEHLAFIPDMIWQESDSYEQYRDDVVPDRSWFLWWD